MKDKKILFSVYAFILTVFFISACSNNSNGVFTLSSGSAYGNSVSVDLYQPVTYELNVSENAAPEISVSLSEDNLPVIYISTENEAGITDREEYVNAVIDISNEKGLVATNGCNFYRNTDDDTFSYAFDSDYAGDVSVTGKVRGRGNVSWYSYPQKGILLNFDDEISICAMTPARKYALVSSYGDADIIRNCVAMDIASCLDGMEYTVCQVPVEVYVDGEYAGIYTLSEHIEEGSNKVNLFSEGDYDTVTASDEDPLYFLLECGGYLHASYTAGQDYFYSGHSPQLFIKYPEIDEKYNDDFNAINSYMTAADSAIISAPYSDEYLDYIDMESWVDWFICMELTVNTDSALCRSTYLYKSADGRLCIGPVWDFDKAFGHGPDNQSYQYWAVPESIYCTNQYNFYYYLYQNDFFMEAVKERWDEKKEELDMVCARAVEKYEALVLPALPEHAALYGKSSSKNGMDSIYSFFTRRYNWIETNIHVDGYNRNDPTMVITFDEYGDFMLVNFEEENVSDEIINVVDETDAEKSDVEENTEE